MKLEELPSANTRCVELETAMDILRNKIQDNTATARNANAANVELMTTIKTFRVEYVELNRQICAVEDEIRKVQVEKAAAQQQALAEENAKRAASSPPQPTMSELMEQIRQLKAKISPEG